MGFCDRRTDGRRIFREDAASRSDGQHTKGFMETYSVPGVMRMDRDCSISKHGFWPSGGNDDLFIYEGV